MVTKKMMEQAHTFVVTEDLLEYLEVLYDRSIDELRVSALAWSLIPLLHLPDGRFTARAWSRALSVFFSKRLRFKRVQDAKLWLCERTLNLE